MKAKTGGSNRRLAIMLGWLTKNKQNPIKANIPSEDRSMFSQEKYKFFLYAPFEISQKCCGVMKKSPSHTYIRETGRKPITAQMASESRLRLQKWLQNGCNAFNSKNPISNPMSFWTEQDIYQYIKENNLPIASVYGDIVVKDNGFQGQVNIHDYLNDYRECEYCTTSCDRTGCMFCGYGLHLEKSPNRFERMAITHPKQFDYVMRGGAFECSVKDKNGYSIKLKHCTEKQIISWCVQNRSNRNFTIKHLWKPSNEGLGYWFCLKWINIHGNFNITVPNYEHYEETYGNELTHYYLYEI